MKLTGYLLDTSIVSALAPGKPLPAGEWVSALRANAARVYLPCITIAELEQGICKLRRAGGRRRAEVLAAWLDGLLSGFADCILPLDADTARRTGQIADRAVAKGQSPGLADVAIAAIAQRHRLLILTRNLRHFQALEAPCSDPMGEPWQAL